MIYAAFVKPGPFVTVPGPTFAENLPHIDQNSNLDFISFLIYVLLREAVSQGAERADGWLIKQDAVVGGLETGQVVEANLKLGVELMQAAGNPRVQVQTIGSLSFTSGPSWNVGFSGRLGF